MVEIDYSDEKVYGIHSQNIVRQLCLHLDRSLTARWRPEGLTCLKGPIKRTREKSRLIVGKVDNRNSEPRGYTRVSKLLNIHFLRHA